MLQRQLEAERQFVVLMIIFFFLELPLDFLGPDVGLPFPLSLSLFLKRVLNVFRQYKREQIWRFL